VISQRDLAEAYSARREFKDAEARYLELRAALLARIDHGTPVESGALVLDVRSIKSHALSRRAVREVYGEEGLQMLLADLPERATRYMRILAANEKPMPEPVDEEWADLVAVKPVKATKPQAKATKPQVKASAKPKSTLVYEGWNGEFD
jgi:hypothetical protein